LGDDKEEDEEVEEEEEEEEEGRGVMQNQMKTPHESCTQKVHCPKP